MKESPTYQAPGKPMRLGPGWEPEGRGRRDTGVTLKLLKIGGSVFRVSIGSGTCIFRCWPPSLCRALASGGESGSPGHWPKALSPGEALIVSVAHVWASMQSPSPHPSPASLRP